MSRNQSCKVDFVNNDLLVMLCPASKTRITPFLAHDIFLVKICNSVNNIKLKKYILMEYTC